MGQIVEASRVEEEYQRRSIAVLLREDSPAKKLLAHNSLRALKEKGEIPGSFGTLIGDFHSGLWFVAERSSETWSRRRAETGGKSFETSPGDKLFQSVLRKHGFRDATGRYHCYITNLIKTQAFVKDWNKKSERERLEEAEAWAGVLAWEIEQGKPKLIVTMGKKVRNIWDHLAAKGLIKGFPEDAMMYVEHYARVALRPEGRHSERGPMHPDRVAEYDAQFAAVARRWRQINAAQ